MTEPLHSWKTLIVGALPILLLISESNPASAQSFTLVSPPGTTVTTAEDQVIEDFNGDGHADFAIGDNGLGSSSIAVHTNLTPLGLQGQFSDGLVLANSSDLPRVASGDVNGDGRPDLVAVSGQSVLFGGTTLQAYLNSTPGGGTVSFSTPASFTLPYEAGPVGIADLHSSAGLELAVVDISAGALRIYGWNGSSLPVELSSLALPSYPGNVAPSSRTRLVFDDLEGDGDTDVVISAISLIYTCLRTGSSFSVTSNSLACGAGIAVGDVDNDGLVDVVASDGLYASPVRLALQVSPGQYVNSAAFIPAQCAGGDCDTAGELALGRANNDDLLDVFFVHGIGGGMYDVSVSINAGQAQFSAPESVSTLESSGANASPSLSVLDADLDGKDDFVRWLVGSAVPSQFESWINSTTGCAPGAFTVIQGSGSNPQDFLVLTQPTIGQNFVSVVLLTPDTIATLVAFGQPSPAPYSVQGVLGELLLDPAFSFFLVATAPPGVHSVLIPQDEQLCGATSACQGFRIELVGGVPVAESLTGALLFLGQ